MGPGSGRHQWVWGRWESLWAGQTGARQKTKSIHAVRPATQHTRSPLSPSPRQVPPSALYQRFWLQLPLPPVPPHSLPGHQGGAPTPISFLCTLPSNPPTLHQLSLSMPWLQPQGCLSVPPNWALPSPAPVHPLPDAPLLSSRPTQLPCPPGVVPSPLRCKLGNFFISQAQALEANGRRHQKWYYHHLRAPTLQKIEM